MPYIMCMACVFISLVMVVYYKLKLKYREYLYTLCIVYSLYCILSVNFVYYIDNFVMPNYYLGRQKLLILTLPIYIRWFKS